MNDLSSAAPNRENYPELFLRRSFSRPTGKQWQQLHELAADIRRLAPWEKLWDDDPLAVFLPDRAEPVFISIIGSFFRCCGIVIYPGYFSYTGNLLLRSNNGRGEPAGLPLSCQNNIICYFGRCDSILPMEQDILNEMDKYLPYEQQDIFFHVYREGYAPWLPDTEQAELLLQILRGLLAILTDIDRLLEQARPIAGKTIAASYSEESKKWQSKVIKAPEIPVQTPCIRITDDLFLAKLRKAPCRGSILEMDLLYLPLINSKKIKYAPAYTMICLIADRFRGTIVDQFLAETDSCTPHGTVMTMLANYINNHGRPRKIYVRNRRMYYLLSEICRVLKIDLVSSWEMPDIDCYINEIIEACRQPD